VFLNNQVIGKSHLNISIATFLFLGPLAPVALARVNPESGTALFASDSGGERVK